MNNDEILCIVELSESPIPDGCLRRLDEVLVKRDGCIWQIHKNDPDPFPSNPHAHNIESGLKLDLSNGKLYLSRKFAGKSVRRKHLKEIRAEVEAKDIVIPSLAV
jgi:hypothetical protein